VTETPAAAVQPPTFTPAWLAPSSVKDWLKLHAQDTDDVALLDRVCASAEPYVQRYRPEFLVTNPDGSTTYTPDAEAYQGAVMYAAREYRRRNSPAGIEMLSGETSFVAKYDSDIDRYLHTGPWSDPTRIA
jgi:hypothetical protein